MAKIAEILNNVVSDSGVEISSLQPLLTNPVTGTGTTNYIPKFTGTSAIGNSDLITDGSGNLAIAQGNAPTQALNIYRAGSTQTVMSAGNSNTGLNGTYFGVDASGNGIINTTGAFANIFSTNGSERMRITSGGDIGIGTTAPSYKLDVQEVIRSKYGSNEGRLYLGGTPAGVAYVAGAVRAAPSPSYSYTGKLSFYTTTWGVGTDYGITEQMYIDTTAADTKAATLVMLPWGGNVGIGTTSPGSNLTIQQASTSATLGIRHTASGNGYGWRFATTGTTTNDLIFSNEFNGSFTERMRLDANGRLGIGTSSPTYSVDVVGYMRTSLGLIGSSGLTMYGDASSATGMFLNTSGNLGLGVTPSAWSSSRKAFEFGNVGKSISGGGNVTEITLGGNAYDAAGGWTYANTAQATAYQQYNGLHTWLTAPSGTAGNAISWTQAMTLDASGRLGIGTTSPDVYGVHAYNASNSVYFKSVSGSTTTLYGSATALGVGLLGTFSNSDLTIYTNSSEKMRITSGGNVGIGTSSPANKLQIGSVGSTGFGGNDIAIGNGSQVMTFYQSATISTWYTNTSFSLMPSGVGAVGNVGIGTTSPSNRLTVSGNADITGNVGIGTPTPAYKLDVNGSFSTVTSSIYLQYNSGILYHFGGSGDYYQYISGANYLLYNRTATGALTFGTQDTERMRIAAGGNVGIGTTSPSTKLDVQGSNGVIASFVGTSGNYGQIYSDGNAAVFGASTTTSLGNNYLYINPSSNFQAFVTNATERMRITSSGNVGIGTTSPTQALEVSGNILFTNKANAILFGATGVDGTWGAPIITRIGAQLIMSDYSGVQFGGYDGSSYGARMTVLGTGNVGIGTTSPSYKLHVVGSIYASNSLTTAGPITVGMAPAPFWNAKFTDYSDGSGVYIGSVQAGGYKYIAGESYYNNSSYWYSDFTTSTVIGLGGGILKFYTDSGLTANTNFIPTERMRITAAGNVGIGTTSPSQKLEVTGIVRGEAVNVYGSTDPASTSPYLYSPSLGALGFGGNGSEKMRITSGGNVLVGTTTDAGYKLNVNGSFYLGTNAYISYGATYPYTINIANTAGVGDIVLNAGAGSSGYESKINLQGGTSGYLQFSTASSERMRITSGGNVGIGTTSPTQKLDVNGNINIPINQSIGSIASYTNIQFGADMAVKVGGSTTAMTIKSTGNVGIGTTAPTQLLTLEGADGYLFTVQENGANKSRFQIYQDDGGSSLVAGYNSTATNMYFYTGSSERMRITSGGDVLVGLTSGGRFSVRDAGGNDTHFGLGATYDNYITAGSSGVTIFRNATTERMRITSGGDVVVGATSNPYTSANRGSIFLNGGIASLYGWGVGGVGKGYLYHDGINVYIENSNSGGNFNLFQVGAGNFTFNTNGSERMRITSGGDVGIGNSSPSTFGGGGLSIGSTTTGKNLMMFSSSAGNNGLIQFYDTNGNSAFQIAATTNVIALYGYSTRNMTFSTNGTEAMRLTSSGELLINTTSDAGDYKLQVNGNVYATGIGYINGGIVGNSSNNLYLSSNSSGGEISFWANQLNTRLMTILGGGDVGIGVSSPSAKLEVNGAIKTAAPSGGTAAAWKLGSRISNTCGLPATYADFTSQFMNTNKVIEIEIGGVTVYVPTVTPGWC